MGIIGSIFLVVYAVILGLALWLGVILSANYDHWLNIFAFIVGIPGMASVFLWGINMPFIMYCVVPKVDKIVDPPTCRHIERYGDNLLFRMHRSSLYTVSASLRFANRRAMPHYDFTHLPTSLRLTLFGNFLALGGVGLLMFPGGGALLLAEKLGYS